AGIGTFGATELAGAVGGPVSDVVGLRAAVRKADSDGWLNNRFSGNDQNGDDDLAWRLLATVVPADAFAARVRVHGGRNRSDSEQYRHLGVLAPESVALGGVAPCALQRIRSGECVDAFGYSERRVGVNLAGQPHPAVPRYDEGNYSFEGRHDSDFWGAALRIDARLGGVAITAITGYDHRDDVRPEDSDASPNEVLTAVLAVEQDTWSQELRFSRQHDAWDWLMGFYYLRDEATDRTSLEVLQDLRYLSATTQEITSLAVFADIGRALSERWSATLGLRYTDEEIEHDVALFVDQPLPPTSAARDSRNWSGRLVFDYRLDDALSFYGGVSTGFKPAGLRTTAQGIFPYEDELLISYETGFNSIQAGGRVHLNGALFYYDYRDLQLFTPLAVDGLPVPVARDTADASVLGAELELQAVVDERMFVRLGVGYLNAEYRSFVSGGQRLSGNDLPLSPRLSFNALVRYQMPVNGNATLTWQGDVGYQDDVFFEARNDPLLRQGSYWMLNARVTWRSAEHWEVAAWARNVLNEEYLTYAFDLPGFGSHRQTLGAPRSYGLEAAYRF
ncbi:MAG: TonB-dependent receptor, partial [Pseudomonadales bacterium]